MTGWRVALGDLTLDEADVTVAQAADICRLAGGGWEALDPMRSVASAAAIVTVMLVGAGRSELEAMLQVNEMTALDLLGCIVSG